MSPKSRFKNTSLLLLLCCVCVGFFSYIVLFSAASVAELYSQRRFDINKTTSTVPEDAMIFAESLNISPSMFNQGELKPRFVNPKHIYSLQVNEDHVYFNSYESQSDLEVDMRRITQNKNQVQLSWHTAIIERRFSLKLDWFDFVEWYASDNLLILNTSGHASTRQTLTQLFGEPISLKGES